MNPDAIDKGKLVISANDIVVSKLSIPKFVTPDYQKMKENNLTYGQLHEMLCVVYFCLEASGIHIPENAVPEEMKKYFKEVKVGW